jgi:hypothetical protein
MILQTLSTIVVGLLIAFIYSWKFALFVFGVMPFILSGAVMQIRIAKGFSMKNMAELVEAGKVSIRWLVFRRKRGLAVYSWFYTDLWFIDLHKSEK